MGGEKIFADSTLVTANASVKSLLPREQIFQPVLSPAEHLKRVFDENSIDTPNKQKENFTSVTGSPSDSDDAIKVYAEDTSTHQKDAPISITSETDNHMIDHQATSQSKRGRRPKPRRIINIFKVSRTDPDASIITRPGLGTILAYKEHFTVDSSHRVITAGEVTPAACEDYRQVSKLLDLQPINSRVFCADSHYGVQEVYALLRDRGILPIIPRHSPQARKPKSGRLASSAFKYIPEADIFRCPQGRELRRVAYDQRWHRYHYCPKPKDCKGCAQRLACSTEKTLRTIIRYPQQEAIDWATSYCETPEGQQTLSHRRSIGEGVIAEAKCFHGLRRAICRGWEKVKIQTLMIATVQNLKRLVKIIFPQLKDSLNKIKQMFYVLIFKVDLCLDGLRQQAHT